MTMDVLSQTRTQAESGEMVREWSLKVAEIPCMARGISGNGIRVVGSTERWNDIHENVEYVKIRTGYLLDKRDRVTNIRDSNGNVAWQELNKSGVEIPIEFDVLGSTPILGPFGDVQEYDVLVTRAEIQ
jgi:hypothetical protein